MSLLALEHVCKSYRVGGRERAVLHDITLELEAGELSVIWGLRRSGRSTLLRVAAGIEAPDRGVVRFQGRDLAEDREAALGGGGIGWCQSTFRSTEGRGVLDQVAVGLLTCGVSPALAHERARDALARVGAERCAALRLGELDGAEALRVGLARTLAVQPRLLVVDEPTRGVDQLDRDDVLRLLRSLADEGIAILASTRESIGLAGADRTWALSDGELRGGHAPKLAEVVALHEAPTRRLRRVAGLRAGIASAEPAVRATLEPSEHA
jgi:ABC-type lipoprotein export system ATPase subunit